MDARAEDRVCSRQRLQKHMAQLNMTQLNKMPHQLIAMQTTPNPT